MGISSKKHLFKQGFDLLHFSPLFLLWYGFLLTIVLIVKMNSAGNYVPGWDPSHHMLMGLNYHQSFSNGDVGTLIHLFFDSEQIYPPLYHMLIALCFELFGITSKSGVYANIPFIFTLIFATYNLGSLISKKIGLISAFLTPLLPIFLSLSESVLLDYSSISLFVLAYYLLFKTDYFTNRKYVLLFSLVVSLNFLIKWSFLAPALPFIYYYLISLLRLPNKTNVLKNGLIVLMFSLPGIVWTVSNLQHLVETLNHYSDETNYPQILWNTPSGLELNNIMLYAYTYPVSGMGIGITALIYTLFALFKTNKKMIEKYLIFSIVELYFVLTSMSDKAEKYFAYIYPLAIILSVSWLQSIKNKYYKKLLQLILYGSVLANVVAIHIPSLNNINLDLVLDIYGQKYPIILLPKYYSNFEDDGWPTEKMIEENLPNSPNKNSLLVLVDHKRVNASTLTFLTRVHKKNIEVIASYNINDPTSDIVGNESDLLKFDYVVTKSGGMGVFANTFTINSYNKILANSPKFVLIAEESSPTGYKIYLYKTIRT